MSQIDELISFNYDLYNIGDFCRYKEMFIVGLSGSGKSTISKHLGRLLNAEVVELDNLYDELCENGEGFDYDSYVLDFIKFHKRPVIFEGIQILRLVDAYSYYDGKPFVVMKTGFLRSSIRAYKRNFKGYNLTHKVTQPFSITKYNFDLGKDIKKFKSVIKNERQTKNQ